MGDTHLLDLNSHVRSISPVTHSTFTSKYSVLTSPAVNNCCLTTDSWLLNKKQQKSEHIWQNTTPGPEPACRPSEKVSSKVTSTFNHNAPGVQGL